MSRRYVVIFCDSINKNLLGPWDNIHVTSSHLGLSIKRRHSTLRSKSEDCGRPQEHCTVNEVKRNDVPKESFPSRTNIDNEGIPMSLLGDGLTKKIRIFNSLKRIKTKTQQFDFSEILPVAVKAQFKDTSTDLLTSYPQLSRLLETTTEKSELPTKAGQYPFAKSILDTTSLTKCANSKDDSIQLEPLHASCREIQEDMLIAREELWKKNLGTPDATLPVSNISCGGCGALFHCKDPSLPGYMHSEKFKFCSKQKLRKELCQRCLYMQHFNVALNVSVSPEAYPKLISEIKHNKALIILMVDLTDFPCSLWPGIIDIVGTTMPVFVVGNKVDLLPCDQRGYLHHIASSLKKSLKNFGVDRNGNIKHVSLISAKTGYGIEELITKLHNTWDNGGDIYLIGCTNVGKSTLFNALLESDLCKVQATDIVQRATISPWPGTTLNLLKFPILRMNRWRMYLRTKRLIKERKLKSDEQKLRKHMFSETKDPQYATLIGRIGVTFKTNNDEEKVVSKRKPFNSNANEFAHGYFCYDTPGAIYHDQILSLLTVEELLLTLPKQIIIPRTYRLFKCQTLFLAGLARIDLIESPCSILITVFASHHLPIHIVYTEQSEKFYNHYLGTEMLAVPNGDLKRLQDFPSLVPKEIEIVGSGWKKSCADISLSSSGWVSITLSNDELCKFLVYTPGGRGCYVRQPSFLPFAVNLKGKRIRGTPAYENLKMSITV